MPQKALPMMQQVIRVRQNQQSKYHLFSPMLVVFGQYELKIENAHITIDLDFRQRSETEEILDSILPPREWEEDGQLWRQSVSSTPATRLDVINLQVCRHAFKI